MMDSKTFSPNQTRIVFLFLLMLLTVCLPAVSAQDMKEREVLFAETAPENHIIEPKTREARILEGFPAGGISDAPNAFQTNGAEKKSADRESSRADFAALTINKPRDFRPARQTARRINFEDALSGAAEKSSFRFTPTNARDSSDDSKRVRFDDKDVKNGASETFRWGPALRQSLLLLGIQHGYALAFQEKTRRALKGKFFKDYIESVKSLHGWDDKGRFFTNYIAHPMQGSVTGFIYVQNKPSEMKLEFAESGDYWRSRLTALAWSAAWSTQFELGPISQASIGNIGLNGKQAYVDLVITPTVGTALLITEDAVDRFLIKPIERRANNLYIRALVRMFLNPTRTLANLFRFKEPWYRDRPLAR